VPGWRRIRKLAYGKPVTENHYQIIARVCKEVSEQYNLKPALKVERVDWFIDGTSYEINDKIVELMSDCGLLIGNLTYCNPESLIARSIAPPDSRSAAFYVPCPRLTANLYRVIGFWRHHAT